MPSPGLTCAFIALSILDATVVLFPEAFVLVKNYFPLQTQLGYAKSILSVSPPFLDSGVSGTKNDPPLEGVWGNTKNEDLSSLSVPRSDFSKVP